MRIWEINEEMGLKKVDNPTTVEGHSYEGVMATGNFEPIKGFDYGVGLLEMSVKCPVARRRPFITITTIDDGVWQAEGSRPVNVNDVARVITHLFRKTLPSETELNDALSQFDIYGAYTG